MAQVAFLGLGITGHPMTGSLADDRHEAAAGARTRTGADGCRAKHGSRRPDASSRIRHSRAA